MYRHINLSVKDCVKMGLSELRVYYQKTVEDYGEEMAEIIWKRNGWHRLFKNKTPHPHPLKEGSDADYDIKEEEEDGDSNKEGMSDEDNGGEDNENNNNDMN
ncbi:hypothetical protein Y1Q_0022682 [Alligator mississippiensis]|uniref:Uncharacterized protein n=2 Tax=Alligator mississippiensis TaxID=8496 RepID=A0A151PHW1_ALLMI|nr:hypothetical protein Y1Q_0022682 [Alligator mississippiensis]